MVTYNSISFGELLQSFRKRRNVSQKELALLIGIHRNTLGGWERGDYLPESRSIIAELAKKLQLDEEETQQLFGLNLMIPTERWSLPFSRNLFFTGRDALLLRIHEILKPQPNSITFSSLALNGIRGIGKTQVAVEYAYRYHFDYTSVFWINAETYDTIMASYQTIASCLDLLDKKGLDLNNLIFRLSRWLNVHSKWLLVIDGVEDLKLMSQFLPNVRRGSILFTTYLPTLDTLAQTIEVEPLTMIEGAQFLLKRANIATSEQQLPKTLLMRAKEVANKMGGVPLALDQVGGYMSITRCSSENIAQQLHEHPLSILGERFSLLSHPLSIVDTFTNTLEKVRQSNPVAADLFTLCIFLSHYPIPEKLFIDGEVFWGMNIDKSLKENYDFFNHLLKDLLAYSLIQRNVTTATVTIPRPIQIAFRAKLPEAIAYSWIRKINKALLYFFRKDYKNASLWSLYDAFLPHVEECIQQGKAWATPSKEVVSLIISVVAYLLMRTRYQKAEKMLQLALNLQEEFFAEDKGCQLSIISKFSLLYIEQGYYEKAEIFIQKALSLYAQSKEENHQDVLVLYGLLSQIYREQERYEEAEEILLVALQNLQPNISSVTGFALPFTDRQESFTLDQRDETCIFHELALLDIKLGKFQKAELYLQHCIYMKEQRYGLDNSDKVVLLTDLAHLYMEQEKYLHADMTLQQALQIQEKTLGSQHPQISYPLMNLGELYYKQGKYKASEIVFKQSLSIQETILGSTNLKVAYSLSLLAQSYTCQGKYESALECLRRALDIREKLLGIDHRSTTAIHRSIQNTIHKMSSNKSEHQCTPQ